MSHALTWGLSRDDPEPEMTRAKAKKRKLDPKLQAWVVAGQRHRFSHANVQMARELGLNPAKLGKIDDHYHEPWKAPLPEFIQSLYEKRFGQDRPDRVYSIEALSRERAHKAQARREAKAARRRARETGSEASTSNGEGAEATGRRASTRTTNSSRSIEHPLRVNSTRSPPPGLLGPHSHRLW